MTVYSGKIEVLSDDYENLKSDILSSPVRIWENYAIQNLLGELSLAEIYLISVRIIQKRKRSNFLSFTMRAFEGFAEDYSEMDVIVPVGCSGSGKTTLASKLPPEFHHINIESNDFDDYYEEFFNLIAEGKKVYFDYTNLTEYDRKPVVFHAKSKKRLKVGGVFMPNTLETVMHRVHTRGYNPVPDHRIIKNYDMVEIPLLGEFDNVYCSF